MARDRGEKHRYGQHYTPPCVARLLASLAIRSATDKVLDPACGDGRLLAAALSIKKELPAASHKDYDALSEDVFGLDRTLSAIPLASKTGAKVACADFFDIEPEAKLNSSIQFPSRFDAVIGNPPYIRHEVMGNADKQRIEKRMEEDRLRSTELFWPRWSKRSDIYVYFFAHAARFLKPEGRLVFLTASSWLDSRYGAPLREFMMENFRVIAIIESAVESFFADASINTAISVLELESNSHKRNSNAVQFVTLLKSLDETSLYDSQDYAGKLVEFIKNNSDNNDSDAYRTRSLEQSKLRSETLRSQRAGASIRKANDDNSWSRHLRADDVFFEILERGGERLKSLSSIAGVRFGVKTGANEFFYVRNANGIKTKNELLALGDVASVRRGLTTGANDFFYLKAAADNINNKPDDHNHLTPLTLVEDGAGAQHLIESEYLAPVIFSLKEIESIVIELEQSRRFFFNCSTSLDQSVHSYALRYIRGGESAGYHERPTCAGRNPWYGAARGMMPAPLIFPAKVGERWIVALNPAGVYEDKKLYGIFPRDKVSKLTLAALLNSTWARYYTEVTCRQMTGAQAIADIDVNVAENIMIPDPRRLSANIKKRLESALMEIARRPVRSVFEEIRFQDRRRLDELTIEATGIDDARERANLIDRLYAALTSLVKARLIRKAVR
jgi:methylase of polypeptide subunit release factors